MAAMQSSMYPNNLRYLAKRLSGVSKNTARLQSLNANTAAAGSIITVDLPSSGLIDLQSLTMYATCTVTGTGFSRPAKHVEALFARVEIEAGGIAIASSPTGYDHLASMLFDCTIGDDASRRRAVSQLGDENAAIPGTANYTGEIACMNWLGFIASASPQVLNMDILPPVRLRITLNNTLALVSNNTAFAAGNASFSLSNVFFSVDTLSINDGLYSQMISSFLNSGNIIELPYSNWFSFSNVGQGMSGVTRFSLSTQSLDRVFAFNVTDRAYPLGTNTGSTLDPVTGNSTGYTRIGTGTRTYGADGTNNTVVTYTQSGWQYNVNGSYLPSWSASTMQSYPLLLSCLNMSADTLGGMSRSLTTPAAWQCGYYVMAQEFCNSDAGYISGLDTRGSSLQAFLQQTGTIGTANNGTGAAAGSSPGTSLTTYVFAQCTSSLKIGAGRSIEVVM